MFLGIHPVDFLVLLVYFAAILYLGVYVGASKTKNLGDFLVAGGKWGPLVSFVFVFASAIAGNEAIVVSGEAYHAGLSGVWYWWSFLFATPIYFLFSTYYRRARVYSLAEFLEMRFQKDAAAVYALVAGVICILFIGMFLLAIGTLLAGFTDRPLMLWVGLISLIVAAYVCSGGMMSALLTDLLQGVMCLLILGFIMLPYVWYSGGGLEALRQLPKEKWDFVQHWDFTSDGMNLGTILALNLSAIVGGIAAPWIYNWMAISKDERTATQCAWGHLWKRLITLVFALYGIFFALIQPGLVGGASESAWGIVMKEVLPVGVGVVGLMIASFFAAAMSSADTYATTSSAMFVDYIYRRVLSRRASREHYLLVARIGVVVSVLVAAISTLFIDSVADYVKLSLSLLSFLGIPIYFGVVWRRASVTGMWMSLVLGIGSYLALKYGYDASFASLVFAPTALAVVGMWIGSLLAPSRDQTQLDRFYLIMNTPIGSEHRLVEAGIRLPALADAGLVEEGPEGLRTDVLTRLTAENAQQKMFGPESTIEIRRERLSWYLPGFISVTAGCFLLIAGTWLVTRMLFVWN